MTEPVLGYQKQPTWRLMAVNEMKVKEEETLRVLDEFRDEMGDELDQRWLSIGRTKLEEAFMAINRAIFRPTRVSLPGDKE